MAVSGGADSMALALLADAWARGQGGSVIALIVDHGLRAASAGEAAQTLGRLAARGIAAHIMRLDGLAAGTRLAERARIARYDALESYCARTGILHLLLGHHAGDQAETVLMREQAASGLWGLAGMAVLRERGAVRLLRPLLAIDPNRLRATLRACGEGWAEDPSNADPAALRTRLRASLETGSAPARLLALARDAGRNRAGAECAVADELAARVSFRPEGFAVIAGCAPLAARSLAAIVRTVSGQPYPPDPAGTRRLAGRLQAATIAGARLVPGGRTAPGGWLVVREPAATGPPVPAQAGAVWDGRFRCLTSAADGAELSALGDNAAEFRRYSDLPSVVLRGLPAVRFGGKVIDALRLDVTAEAQRSTIVWSPAEPASCAPFKQPCRNC